MDRIPGDLVRAIFFAGNYGEVRRTRDLEPIVAKFGYEIDWSKDEERRARFEAAGLDVGENGTAELGEPEPKHRKNGYLYVPTEPEGKKDRNLWRWPYSRGCYL